MQGHVGWPPDRRLVWERIQHGLPVYCPTDPKEIDQRPYIEFNERDTTPAYQKEHAR